MNNNDPDKIKLLKGAVKSMLLICEAVVKVEDRVEAIAQDEKTPMYVREGYLEASRFASYVRSHLPLRSVEEAIRQIEEGK